MRVGCLKAVALELPFVYNGRCQERREIAKTERKHMTTRHLMWSLLMVLTAGVARAESPASKETKNENAKRVAAARRAWTITDLVLEQDIDPPARQQSCLRVSVSTWAFGRGS